MSLKAKLLIYSISVIALCMFASAVSAAELKLLGVKLGSPVAKVLAKYGDPADIRVGGGAGQGGAGAVAGGRAMGGGMRPGMGGPGGMRGPGMGGPGGMRGPGMGGPGGMRGPAMGGMMGGPGGMRGGRPGAAGGQSAQPAGPPEVTWIYKFDKGRTMELLINPDGIVVQITVYGSNWPSIRTAKGITLGSSYKDLIYKYGYPEAHQQQGVQLLMRYQKKNRVVFTTVGRTVVGITIAL